VTKNKSDACKYHPDEMERVMESFEDYSDLDSEFDREENPGGYMYNCCFMRGDDVGCTACPHKEI
jgi:hypothetical protein